MRSFIEVTTVAVMIATLGCRGPVETEAVDVEMPLPAPSTSSSVALETALAMRKPARAFAAGEIGASDLAQMLWSTRATPRLGALPLDVYVASSAGVTRYVGASHALVMVTAEDLRKAIAQATGEPEDVRDAPLLVVLVGSPAKGRAKYGERADRFAAIETGHAAQNVLLQATALGLAATPLALFHEDGVSRALGLSREQIPLHIVAVGKPL